jgi:hypothetical protein
MYLPSGHLVKNNAFIQFPEVLDLNELILGKVSIPSFRQNSTVQVPKSVTQTKNTPLHYEMDEISNYFPPITPELQKKILSELNHDSVPALELVETFETSPSTVWEPQRPFRYQLSALILHYGHHDAGHFIAIRRVKYRTPSGMRDAWFRVSDATVDRILDIENDVFYHGSRFCYMLFYERE